MDVLSLGVGGQIVLSFGDRMIVDGPGPDLVVFENPFLIGGDPDAPFAELAEVAVSEDGESWHRFVCEPGGDVERWPGCAGWRLTAQFDPCAPTADTTGGDPFDLAELGLSRARYVRITDLSADGEAPSAGFDLDAVAILNAE